MSHLYEKYREKCNKLKRGIDIIVLKEIGILWKS